MTESRQVRRARERAEAKEVRAAVKKAGLTDAETKLLHQSIYGGGINVSNSPPKVEEPKTLSEKFYVLAYEFTEEEIAVKVASDMEHKNPMRYRSDHEDQHKGQVWGGECNRTACDSHGAEWWNMGTYALYCTPCGRAINYRPKSQLCVHVDAKPARETHEQFKTDHGYYSLEF